MRSANGVFFSFIFNVESHWNADQTNFVSHMAIIMNLPLAKITDLCGIFISSLFETFRRFNHRKYKRQHVSKHNCFFIFGFIYLDVCVCVKLWTLARSICIVQHWYFCRVFVFDSMKIPKFLNSFLLFHSKRIKYNKNYSLQQYLGFNGIVQANTLHFLR